MFTLSVVIGGFDWASLTKGSIVVDVGGGLGGLDIDLAKKFKELQFICQDRPETVAEADKVRLFIHFKVVAGVLMKALDVARAAQ